MHECGLGDAGAAALADAAVRSPRMWSLSLDGNEIGDAGLTAVGAALHGHPRMARLSLRDQRERRAGRMTRVGVRAVLDGVRRSWRMSSVEFYGNGEIGWPGSGADFAAAFAAVAVRERFAAFAGAARRSPAPPCPAAKFVRADGDDALAHRVARFLVEMEAADENDGA